MNVELRFTSLDARSAVWFSFFPLLFWSFRCFRLLIRSFRGPSVLRITGSLYVGFFVAHGFRAKFSVFYSWEAWSHSLCRMAWVLFFLCFSLVGTVGDLRIENSFLVLGAFGFCLGLNPIFSPQPAECGAEEFL